MGGEQVDDRLLRLVDLPAKTALSGAYDGFMIDREAMRCTAKTLAFYKYALGDFLTYLRSQSIVAPGSMTAGHIRAFFVDLDRHGYKDTTVHVHARAVKTFCRWTTAEGLVPAHPMARVSMPRLSKRVLPALTFDQVSQRLAVASLRDKAVLLCLLDSGYRRLSSFE
jgi:site-specific recombinase XerD